MWEGILGTEKLSVGLLRGCIGQGKRDEKGGGQ